MIALVVFTDGRASCISRTIPSALANLDGPITRTLIYNDSEDPQYMDWLRTTFGQQFQVIGDRTRRGFGGAIRYVWSLLADLPQPYIFHLEDDFTFNRPVDLFTMMDVLRNNRHLIQLALRRQPWNDDERMAGGIVEQHPDAYTEVCDDHACWLEHRLFFTTNPSLYRTALTTIPWPDVKHSEGIFTHQLLDADPDARFAFWGRRSDGEWVTHLGAQRVGSGY